MKAAFIVTGGIGDVLFGLAGATLWAQRWEIQPDIYINSHDEIVEFVAKCTSFNAFSCGDRHDTFKDPENPLNLNPELLERLIKGYDEVYSCFPDSLGQAPFAFPWFKYARSYKNFMQTKVDIQRAPHFPVGSISPNTKNIFIHATSVTMEKNYALPRLQQLVNLFNQTNYNVIICRSSSWKGIPLPFFMMGTFYDLVDIPIDEVVNAMAACDYFIGIDSGPAHIAYHLGLPRIVLQGNNHPFHLVRYHEDPTDDMALDAPPEQIFNRAMLNLRDPITQAIPAYYNIPYQTNTKQLLLKKYYD